MERPLGDRHEAVLARQSSGASRVRRTSCGSSDLFDRQEAVSPSASMNTAVLHDGFTVAEDLELFRPCRTRENGEDNNHGAGETSSPTRALKARREKSISRRARIQRAMLATVMFAHGTPMLLGGDEWARTQGGNEQCLLPGQRDFLVGSDLGHSAQGRDLRSFVARARSAAPGAYRVALASLPARPARAGAGYLRHRLV